MMTTKNVLKMDRQRFIIIFSFFVVGKDSREVNFIETRP